MKIIVQQITCPSARLFVLLALTLLACTQKPPDPQELKTQIEEHLEQGDDVAVLAAAEALKGIWENANLTAIALADSLRNLGLEIYQDDRFEDVAGLGFLFDAAAEIVLGQEMPDPLLGSDILSMCAIYSYTLHNYQRAAHLESVALHLLDQANAVEGIDMIAAKIELSKSFILAGQASNAVALLEPLLEDTTAVSLEDSLRAELWISAGEAYRLAGLHSEGANYAKLAVGLLDGKQNTAAYIPAMHAVALINLGGVHYDRGDMGQAQDAYERAASVASRHPDDAPPSVALLTIMNRAEVARVQHQLGAAMDLFQSAVAFADSTGISADLMCWSTLAQYGACLADIGRTDEAIERFQQALEILGRFGSGGESLIPIVLLHQADALIEKGRLDEAIVALESGLRLVSKYQGERSPEAAVCRAKLGMALGIHGSRDREASDFLLDAIQQLDAAPTYPETRAEALMVLAKIEWADGEREKAIATASRALDGVEFLRTSVGSHELVRARYFEEYVDDYWTLSGWLYDLGHVDEAFAIAERARARALLERRRRHMGPAALPPEHTTLRHAEQTYSQARARVIELGREGSSTDNATYSAAQRKCDEAFRAVLAAQEQVARSFERTFNSSTPAASLQQLRNRSLDDDSCYLAWQIGNDASRLWIVDRSAEPMLVELQVQKPLGTILGLQSSRSLRRDHLDRLIFGSPNGDPHRGILEMLAEARDSLPAPARHALHALYTALVPPSVRDRLAGAGEVLVVVDDAVAAIPIHSWIVDLAGSSPTYWVDTMPPVRYIPSAVFLDTGKDPERRGARTFVAVGGVEFAAQTESDTAAHSMHFNRLRPLPGTQAEVESIRRIFGSEDLVMLTGREATESRVRRHLQAARVIHLATHGIVEQRGMDLTAAIALARSIGQRRPEDDGFLDLHEILELTLAADLVVLSACESGRGELLRGEGTYALSRAFLSAGASGVVHSLWSIHDVTTAFLIDAFYDAWSKDSASIAAALRRAQLTLKQQPDFSSPYYWAPLVYTGR